MLQIRMAHRHDVANSPNASRQTTAGGINCQSRLAAIVCATSILFCASPARADSTPRSFVGNFIGNDATVENYLSISGGVDRTQNFESLYLEKTISSKSSFSLSEPGARITT